MKKRMLALLLIALLALQVFAPATFATTAQEDASATEVTAPAVSPLRRVELVLRDSSAQADLARVVPLAGAEMRLQIDRDAEGTPGSIVEVTVHVGQNVTPGWINMTYQLSFDPAVLTLLDWVHPWGATMDNEPFAGNHHPMWAPVLDFDPVYVNNARMRSGSLVNHGVYEGGGAFENGIGFFRPTDPIEDWNYMSVSFVPTHPLHAMGRTGDFFTVFRFQINENAAPGTTTEIFWEFFGGAPGTDTPGVAGSPAIPRVPTPLPEENGLVTVVARQIDITFDPNGGSWTEFGDEPLIFTMVEGDTYWDARNELLAYTGGLLSPDVVPEINGCDNYAFVAWVTEEGDRLWDIRLDTITGPRTLYAEWNHLCDICDDCDYPECECICVDGYTITFHLYDGSDDYIEIDVVPGEPVTLPTEILTMVDAVVDGRGHALWGWFTHDALDASGRTRDVAGETFRRPVVGTNGFNIISLETAGWTLPFDTDNNFDFHAIWILWGDVNDDDYVDHVDLAIMMSFFANVPDMVMVMPAANVYTSFEADGRTPIVGHPDLGRMMSFFANVPGVVLGPGT